MAEEHKWKSLESAFETKAASVLKPYIVSVRKWYTFEKAILYCILDERQNDDVQKDIISKLNKQNKALAQGIQNLMSELETGGIKSEPEFNNYAIELKELLLSSAQGAKADQVDRMIDGFETLFHYPLAVCILQNDGDVFAESFFSNKFTFYVLIHELTNNLREYYNINPVASAKPEIFFRFDPANIPLTPERQGPVSLTFPPSSNNSSTNNFNNSVHSNNNNRGNNARNPSASIVDDDATLSGFLRDMKRYLGRPYVDPLKGAPKSVILQYINESEPNPHNVKNNLKLVLDNQSSNNYTSSVNSNSSTTGPPDNSILDTTAAIPNNNDNNSSSTNNANNHNNNGDNDGASNNNMDNSFIPIDHGQNTSNNRALEQSNNSSVNNNTNQPNVGVLVEPLVDTGYEEEGEAMNIDSPQEAGSSTASTPSSLNNSLNENSTSSAPPGKKTRKIEAEHEGEE